MEAGIEINKLETQSARARLELYLCMAMLLICPSPEKGQGCRGLLRIPRPSVWLSFSLP